MKGRLATPFHRAIQVVPVIWLLGVLGIVVIVLTQLLLAAPPSVAGTALSDIRTYRSEASQPDTRTPERVFKEGDAIQVGFRYAALSEQQAEHALVTFAVLARPEQIEVFDTNAFRLEPGKSELFVNLNNTNLPPGDYTVELRETGGKTVARVDYTIEEK